MEIIIRINLGAIPAVILALIMFGVLYNQAITWLENRRYLEGFVSIAVASGCLVTLAIVAIVSWEAALITLIGLTFSGVPMIVGSLARYMIARDRSRRAIINEVSNDTTSTLAK